VRKIDGLVRLDVTLVDQAGDGAVHDADTPAPAVLQVVLEGGRAPSSETVTV
jgi:hypothetical protein